MIMIISIFKLLVQEKKIEDKLCPGNEKEKTYTECFPEKNSFEINIETNFYGKEQLDFLFDIGELKDEAKKKNYKRDYVNRVFL